MAANPRSPLALLKAAFEAVFVNDLSLARGKDGVRVAWRDRQGRPVARAPSAAERAALKEQQELELAREQLAALFDEDTALRSSMRHLAFIEHALERKGWRGLYKVPLDVLERAHAQLESHVTNWSAAGLASLRSKMAVALARRAGEDEPHVPGSSLPTGEVLESPHIVAAQAIGAAKAAAAVAAPPAAEDDEAAALRATYAALGIAAPADAPAETAAPR